MAHEIGLRLAKALWGEKYQVLVATHLDKSNHLHNHFVVNTVSFIDGIKYHRTEKDYYDMQRESDRLCREYGLSVIEHPQRGKSKHYGEWRAEQEGRPTYLSLIKADVDAAIRQSMTERQFFYHLRQMGYDIKVGKDITVRAPGRDSGRKLMRNLGEAYSLENIRKRILAQRRPPEGGSAGAEAVQAFGGFEAGQEGDRLSRPLLPLLLSAGGIPQKAEAAAGPCAPRAAGGLDPGTGIDGRGTAFIPSLH